MVTGIISSLLPTFLLTASLTASPTPQASIARSDLTPLSIASFSAYLSPSTIYVVNSGDTLASIARSHYGNEEYWTSIWNDNDWIEDPNTIEVGWKLKVRTTQPVLIEELKPDLSRKLSLESSHSISESEAAVSTTPPLTAISASVPFPTTPNGPLSEAQVTFLGNCESGMTASRNSGNGYYGAFQFSLGTWHSMGTGYERADMAPLEVQIDAVQRLVSRSSIWSQFPGCSAQMHAVGLL